MFRKYGWPIIGLLVVAISIWLLYRELRGLSLEDLGDSFESITLTHWLLAGAGAVFAYAALAGYDALALRYLGRRVDRLFITLTSFTTYALSHNIGASVLSGSIIRYRAYSSKGLSGLEIGQLIAFCSFTFALGTIVLTGMVLAIDPMIAVRLADGLSPHVARSIGLLLLLAVIAYVYGSWKQMKPFKIGPLRIEYPNLKIVGLQLIIGPLELIGAAAIIYFALPAAVNPGFFTVLGIFLMSFSAALISSAPGGLGVLELLFVSALPEVPPSDLLAALIVFRLLYLLVPFAISIVMVIFFEKRNFGRGLEP
ncbi:YbhN family protein [Rhizobium helianthi]|uniref:YbhN family protein n=1 Tax=Rhizobium helianthi TaxID=1132695 RepID=A0ABW4M2E4_9HYPH